MNRMFTPSRNSEKWMQPITTVNNCHGTGSVSGDDIETRESICLHDETPGSVSSSESDTQGTNLTNSTPFCATDIPYLADNYPQSSSGGVVSEHPSESSAQPDIIYDASMGFDRYSNYSPLLIDPNLPYFEGSSWDHPMNILGSQLNIPAWNYKLGFENDQKLWEYIAYGINNGYLIVDDDVHIPQYERKNYGSVAAGAAFNFVNGLILEELECGKLKFADSKPHCIHSIGAVPKKDGVSWRPITDCSCPADQSFNSHMSSTFKEFCYASVD